MARKRSTETIDAEIAKVMADMSKLDTIMEAYLKSGKSLEEIMTFLKP